MICEECSAPVSAKGLCVSHYAKMRYANRASCRYEPSDGAPGCENKSMSRGYCVKHKHGPQPKRYCLHCGADISHRRSNAKFCSKVHSVSWRYWNVAGVREQAKANYDRRKSAGLRRSLSQEEILGHWPGIECDDQAISLHNANHATL